MKESKLSRLFRGARLQCPFCGGRFKKMLPFGLDLPVLRDRRVVGAGLRPDALCPRCGSLDRERLVYLYLKHRTGVFRDRLALLHVAPERNLQRLLASAPNIDYLSADLASPVVDVKMDVAHIPLGGEAFDVIVCNHVLEHVPDDRRAMAELRRVLKPGGWAVLQVPIALDLEETFEDPEAVEPEKRERLFGQSDHVRLYGRDYAGRLEEAGFGVEAFSPEEEFGGAFCRRYGLSPEERVYLCSKS